MSTTSPSVSGAHVTRSKTWSWFKSFIGFRLTPSGRKLFEEYSGLAPSEIESHIFEIINLGAIQRDSAWEVFPWPCIGEFWFASFGLSLHPSYYKILARLQSPQPTTIFLDLGTCVGQDLRKLVYDGVALDNIYGFDIFPDYERVGHALFRDESTFQGRFISADLFDEAAGAPLAKTRGTWDIINIIMFLHVFDRKDQVRSCQRILGLLSEAPGSMIVGAQTATTKPGEYVLKPPFVAEGEHKSIYRQSRETFRTMWEEIGQDLGVKLDIWAEYEETKDEGQKGDEEKFFTGDEQRRLFFVVER